MRQKTSKLIRSRWLKRKILRKWLRVLTGMVGFLGLVLGTAFFLKSDFWRAKRINCQLNGHDCPAELRSSLMGLFQAENILFFSTPRAVKKVQDVFPGLSQVRIEKHFPQELLFELEERKPVAAVTLKNEGATDFFWLDQEGIFLRKTTSRDDLPLVLVVSWPPLAVGEKLPLEGLEAIIFLLTNLKWRLLAPKQAEIVDSSKAKVWLADNLQVTFSLQKDLDDQLASLQLILSRTKIEGKPPKRVDLFFDKPVIAYE